jgi:hypothetical protein
VTPQWKTQPQSRTARVSEKAMKTAQSDEDREELKKDSEGTSPWFLVDCLHFFTHTSLTVPTRTDPASHFVRTKEYALP